MTTMPIRQQTLERVNSLCHGSILSKIWAGAEYAARGYIYQGSSVSDMELNSPQCILLALLYSLVVQDIMSCCLLADVCHHFQQLKSDYLRIWLTGDFEFPQQDMEKAMALLSNLLEVGVLKLPSHVTKIMFSLAARNRIPGTQLLSLSTEGRRDLASCLQEAVVNNSPGDIITIACEGGDVNGSTQSGDSLVHLAVRLGNYLSIPALGFMKANLEVLNSSNATPLEEAIKNNHISSVKALLSAGADVNKHFFRGDTYTHIAASGGYNEALGVLLERGMDMNKMNHFRETPLFQAVTAGNVRGVEILLEKGANSKILPEGGKSLIEMGIESHNAKMFKALVKSGKNLHSKDGNTVYHLVAHLGNVEMINGIKEISLQGKEVRIDINGKTKNGETALYLASVRGSLELVKLLYQEGANVDSQDNNGISALMIALQNSKEDIATFLLYKGANLKLKDKEGRTALHYAAEGGCVGVVETLLDAGVSVNELDIKGDTPAHIAAVNKKPAVLRLLVGKGADLALRDHDGNGILHCEARNGQVEVVTMLLYAGMEVDTKGQWDYTALHWAAREGHTAVVAELLDHGADPAARSRNGNTPLMLASYCGQFPAVELLVVHGAELNTKDNDGWTALKWANNKKHKAVADYLKSRGGVE